MTETAASPDGTLERTADALADAGSGGGGGATSSAVSDGGVTGGAACDAPGVVAAEGTAACETNPGPPR